ncbi:MAG: hypothetical protein WBG37_00560 [Desulfobacterales bacterium]
MKKFCYLIQAAEGMPYPQIPHGDNDIFLLTWKTPAEGKRCLFYPGSSWNEGRNRLLKAALDHGRERGEDYLYYIFMDDDCEVSEDRELARRLGIELTGNPFRTFERCLLEWEPAVGYTRYDWQHCEEGREVNLGYNFDAIFNAFHQETLDFLLPYYTGFDNESWLYSQMLINHLAAMVYHPHRIQFNVIRTVNRRLKGYTARKKFWSIPTTFMANAVRSDLTRKMNTRRPNDPRPPKDAEPRKKARGYKIEPREFQRHFDPDHPFFRDRRLTSRAPYRYSSPRRKSGLRTAVCISGSCRMLDVTLPNLEKFVFDVLEHYDLFVYAPRDAFSPLAERLPATLLKVAADRKLPETGLRNGATCRLKSGVQGYLQQLYGLKMCHNLMRKFQRENNIYYDCVIRCRPDLNFLSPIPDPRRLDGDYLYVPDFHQFDGVNDRFAMGGSAQMAVYLDKYDALHGYVARWMARNPHALPVSAEMFTAGHLREAGIPVRQLPIRFNRVRRHGEIEDTEPGESCL